MPGKIEKDPYVPVESRKDCCPEYSKICMKGPDQNILGLKIVNGRWSAENALMLTGHVFT